MKDLDERLCETLEYDDRLWIEKQMKIIAEHSRQQLTSTIWGAVIVSILVHLFISILNR